MPIERGCEAEINQKTLDSGASRVAYDFEGRRIDQGPDFQERPAKEQVAISCDRCDLATVINTEGGAPFGAYNEAKRQIESFIRNNCQKLRDEGYKPEQMPEGWIPR